MVSVRIAALAAASLTLVAGAALAQPAAPPPLATPNPTYVAIVMEQDVARPAAEVWKRVGKYCDIGEWSPGLKCEITSGKDGELGAVRTLNGSTIEVLVAKTDLSYTYAQPVRVGQPYNMYHGTLEARPVTARTSKLVYSLVLDNSMLPDDAARTADVERRRTRFTQALKDMKTLTEGGKLAPPAAGR